MAPPQSTTISLSVRDASIVTGLSEWEIRDKVNKGVIPARRHGKRILIDHAALLAWYHTLPAVTDISDAS